MCDYYIIIECLRVINPRMDTQSMLPVSCVIRLARDLDAQEDGS